MQFLSSSHINKLMHTALSELQTATECPELAERAAWKIVVTLTHYIFLGNLGMGCKSISPWYGEASSEKEGERKGHSVCNDAKWDKASLWYYYATISDVDAFMQLLLYCKREALELLWRHTHFFRTANGAEGSGLSQTPAKQKKPCLQEYSIFVMFHLRWWI